MGTQVIQILLIEDTTIIADLIRDLLSDSNMIQYELTHSETLGSALENLNCNEYDVILLDLDLPDSVGIDTFKRPLYARD